MKTTVELILLHIINNNLPGQAPTKITAGFRGSVTTNALPDVGHNIWLYVWEPPEETWSDANNYILEKGDIHHELVNGVFKQSITVRMELECPDEVPENGTLERLIQREMDDIRNDIAPRLAKQGLQMITEPNLGGRAAPAKEISGETSGAKKAFKRQPRR